MSNAVKVTNTLDLPDRRGLGFEKPILAGGIPNVPNVPSLRWDWISPGNNRIEVTQDGDVKSLLT